MKLRFWQRAIVSLAFGSVLTFAVPTVLDAVWSHLQDEHFRVPALVSWTVTLLNLPAVIYCNFFILPESLPRGDESLYCWAVTFWFNIPYYAIVIFIIWSIASAAINSDRNPIAKDQINAQL
jgi:hypothetical protein